MLIIILPPHMRDKNDSIPPHVREQKWFSSKSQHYKYKYFLNYYNTEPQFKVSSLRNFIVLKFGVDILQET